MKSSTIQQEITNTSKEPTEAKKEQDRLIAVFISLIIIAVFWMAFEQAGGLMNLYTQQYTNRDFFGIFEIPAGVFQSLNAGYILIFGAFVAAFWDGFVRRGKHIGGIFKMGIGTVIMGVGFIFMVFAANEKEVATLAGEGVEPVQILVPQDKLVALNKGTEEKDSIKTTVWSLGEVNEKLSDNQEVLIYPNTVIQWVNKEGKKERTLEKAIFCIPAKQDTSYVAMEVTEIKLAAENPELISNQRYAQLTVKGTSQKTEEPMSIPIVKSGTLWLLLAYLFHTLGELCLSPVSLSFITKVAPKRIVASMMGIYWAVIGLGNKLAAEIGKYADSLGEYTIFLGLFIFPAVMGGLLMLFSSQISKLTHGAEEVNLEKEKA